MYVIHDPATGAVLATLQVGPRGDPPRSGAWIEVPDQDLGDLQDWRVGTGALIRVSIDAARRRAIARVNAGAADIRRRYITEIPGQEMIYLQKEAEAAAFLADPAPDLAAYPFIAAEIGATAPSAHEVAQVYVNLAALLRSAGAALEQVRLGAIADIEAAGTPGEIEAALTGFEVGLAALD